MICTIDWETFHAKYLNQETIYMKEDENYWWFYTQDKHFYIKCVVPKSENQEENIMLIERYFQGRTNVIKCIEIDDASEESIQTTDDESTLEPSDDAIRDKDGRDFENRGEIRLSDFIN